mmetsp:Transcript_46227/g.104402  ORF Transcript_46227/g.104402 Transcript_46227/m.104402 type:complete len:224 (-) Transcript_46227:276-947(-)
MLDLQPVLPVRLLSAGPTSSTTRMRWLTMAAEGAAEVLPPVFALAAALALASLRRRSRTPERNRGNSPMAKSRVSLWVAPSWWPTSTYTTCPRPQFSQAPLSSSRLLPMSRTTSPASAKVATRVRQTRIDGSSSVVVSLAGGWEKNVLWCFFILFFGQGFVQYSLWPPQVGTKLSLCRTARRPRTRSSRLIQSIPGRPRSFRFSVSCTMWLRRSSSLAVVNVA